MNYVLFRLSFITLMLGLSYTVSAVGIPVIDPGAPIKISESKFYSCDADGNALNEQGVMRYKNKIVSCHNDNLWADGKALNYIDLTTDFLDNASKSQQERNSGGIMK
ncbi:hypothetical protein D6O87_25590 [Escherichia coli]|nr:hypothetical protein [Escherichia coli]